MPQPHLSDDILKNLYYFVSKLFNGLIDRLPQFFHSASVWKMVIGENYYITSIQGFFKDSDLANSKLAGKKLHHNIQQQYFSQHFVESMSNKIDSKIISADRFSH